MPQRADKPPRAIRAAGLSLRRGARLLFDNLDFAVPQGQAMLVLGPNGAGKTSLLLALAGLLRPEAGAISFISRNGDIRPGSDIHLLTQKPAFKPRLTVAENLKFWAGINGGPQRRLEHAIDTAGLTPLSDLDAGYLSSGQLRRLALARLLVTPRPFWLLDEPTTNLDAEGEALVAALVDLHTANGGVAIIATHHRLDLAQAPETLQLGGAE